MLALLVISSIHRLAAIILASLPLLHSCLLPSSLGRRDVSHGLLERGSHGGGHPDQGGVCCWPGHGGLYGWPHFYHHLRGALLVQVPRDLLRLHWLDIAVLAQGAARGVQEGGEVSGLVLAAGPAFVGIVEVRST